MFIVYALHSPHFQKIYIGFTSNIAERLKAHNELATKGWTMKFRPWTIVHAEEFSSKQEAMAREKQLKSAAGREFIWNKVKSIEL